MKVFTVPNILSSIRIVIAFTAPFMLIDSSLKVRLGVGIICFIAVLTDWFDGWYARKYNAESKIGKLLDPIADKALVLVVFSVLAYLEVLSFLWVVPIFLREVIITTYRFIFLSRNIVVAAVKSGKIKTFMQMFTLGLAYTLFMLNRHFPEYFSHYFWIALYVCLSLTVFLTLQSGYHFFKNNWRMVKSVHNLV